MSRRRAVKDTRERWFIAILRTTVRISDVVEVVGDVK